MAITIDFKEEDWKFETGSGYNGFRNTETDEWVYPDVYFNRLKRFKDYEKDYELIREFRLECLPFGKYGDIVIQDFLNEKYDGNNNLK